MAAMIGLVSAGRVYCEPSPYDKETAKLRANISNVVIINLSSHSFDNIFGDFPGARGLSEVLSTDGRPTQNYHPQRDRDGRVLLQLPPTWGGVTPPGRSQVVTQGQSLGLPNVPYAIESAFAERSGVILSTASITRDIWSRFFESQMEINKGANDGFASWSDSGGLALGYFDYRKSQLYQIARDFTLADNYFQGTFGGGFLNLQYLACACAPIYNDADRLRNGLGPPITILERDETGGYLPRLVSAPTSSASALESPPQFILSGNIAPENYFGDGKYHAINTMQPAFQPSGNKPQRSGDGSELYADPGMQTTLPPLTAPTIGDLLSKHGIAWTWYAGNWNAAVAEGRSPPSEPRLVIYPFRATGYFPHLSPFNYYAEFDPREHASARDAHLKDFDDLVASASKGKLPPVSFYQPAPDLSQRRGSANLMDGDAHVAALIEKLKSSPQWKKMIIVITYDQSGGTWDHIAPPIGDMLGPGNRVPAIIVSPKARRGYVDHTQMDSGSILRLIARLFDVERLSGLDIRDQGAISHGYPPFGDFTSSLDLR